MICLLAGLLLAGCGNGSPPPEAVVRAWSDAVNSGDNERAAKLLAPGAIAIQGTQEHVLRQYADAVDWNAAQPCARLVRSILTHGDIVTATFLLRDRAAKGGCARAGGTETTEFEVRDKRIVFLRRLASAPAPPAGG